MTITIPTLVSERLALRGFRQSDFTAYAGMCADARFMHFLAGGKPLDEEESWRSMAGLMGHWALLGFGIWAVEERSSGELIGRVGLHSPEGGPGVELTWALTPAHWGKGYGTEAVQMASQWAFDNLDISELISFVDPDNERSDALARRIGATLEGQFTIQGHASRLYTLSRNAEVDALALN